MLTLICLLRDAVQVFAQRVDLAAGLADHDAGPRGADVDLDLVARSCWIVMSERPACASLLDDVLADADVLLRGTPAKLRSLNQFDCQSWM